MIWVLGLYSKVQLPISWNDHSGNWPIQTKSVAPDKWLGATLKCCDFYAFDDDLRGHIAEKHKKNVNFTMKYIKLMLPPYFHWSLEFTSWFLITSSSPIMAIKQQVVSLVCPFIIFNFYPMFVTVDNKWHGYASVD